MYTVEPPNKGHVGTSRYVLYREVLLIQSGGSTVLQNFKLRTVMLISNGYTKIVHCLKVTDFLENI